MFERTFIEECLEGFAELKDLDTFVDYWHTHELQLSLREFLGMTEYEYEKWIQNDDSIIRDILRCRVDGVPFEQYQIMTNDEKIAARSYSIEDISKLKGQRRYDK